ncbi:TPA: hypothetical protein ACRZZH_003130 [Vibrio harveyi]
MNYHNLLLPAMVFVSLPSYSQDIELFMNYEFQSDQVSKLEFEIDRYFINNQRFSFDVGVIKSQSQEDYAASFGAKYGQPIFNNNWFLEFIATHNLVEKRSPISSAQVGLGLSYASRIGQNVLTKIDFGLLSNLDNKSGNDSVSPFLSLSLGFIPNHQSDSILDTETYPDVQDSSTEEKVISTYYFDVDKYSSNRKIDETGEFGLNNNLEFKAYYSCSASKKYNENLSLKRIESVYNDISSRFINVANITYSIIHSCVDEEDIRVEVIKK